jgi:non-ribosomal peptide synthetase component E (peptide arylation enzyme)
MAANLADLFEHAADAFAGRVAVACGDRQVTYREPIVLDDAGRRAGPGQAGRIARGGHVPLGYYHDPARTAAMFAEVDGRRYAVPGDYARVEEDGRLTLLGRGPPARPDRRLPAAAQHLAGGRHRPDGGRQG